MKMTLLAQVGIGAALSVVFLWKWLGDPGVTLQSPLVAGDVLIAVGPAVLILFVCLGAVAKRVDKLTERPKSKRLH